jgi:CubicO group peptidase (beta-lactamase class C family)
MRRVALFTNKFKGKVTHSLNMRKYLGARLTALAIAGASLFQAVAPAKPSPQAFLYSKQEQALGANASEQISLADAKSIELRIKDVMQKDGFPGFSVGIVFEDNLIYSQSFGVIDRDTKRSATADTLYQIGSISKVFTATLLAVMRDKGIVSLDDPVSKYLPAEVKLPTDKRGAPMITFRHLATHVSGLPPDVVNPSREKDGDPWRGYSVDSLYAGLAQTKLAFPTGARSGYSNLGYGLLGLALERAAGKPYEALLKQYIFDPLKMENSTITLKEKHLKLLATPYRDDNPMVKTQPWDLGVLSSAGGVTSSVADLSKFLSLQFHAGEANITPVAGSTLLELQTPQRFITEWSSAYGLGWRIDRSDKIGNVVSHGGDVDGYASYLAFSPLHKIGVIVLTNSGIGRPVGEFGGWLMNLAVRSIRPSLSKVPSLEEANIYHLSADWENASWAYEAITKQNPTNGFAFSRLGQALSSLQKYDQAAIAYEKSLALKFRPPNTMYNLACVYSLKGDKDKAFQWLERALAAGFENSTALQTDSDLNNLRGDARFKQLLQRYR